MPKKILEKLVKLNIIQSPFGSKLGSKLCKIVCWRREKIWICGDDGKITQSRGTL